VGSRTDEEKEFNRVLYRIVEKAVAVANNHAYEMLYQRLSSKEGENEVFELAKARER